MKMFQVLIILLFLFPISHALSCITGDISDIPLANFTIQSFEEDINDLDVDEDDKVKLCRIELLLHYSAQYLQVSFGLELAESELPDGQVRFDTAIVLMGDGSTGLLNFLEYACSDEGCDKAFAIKHISWLLNSQYTSLNTKVRPLLLGNTKDAVKCFVNDSTTQICPTGICIAKHDHEEIFYEQACGNRNDLGFRLQFTTFAKADENETDRSTYFQCGYNECNKKSILAQIRTVVEENYDLRPMLTALDMLHESDKTTAKASSSLVSTTISMAVSSKSTNTSTMAVSTTTTTITKASASLVSTTISMAVSSKSTNTSTMAGTPTTTATETEAPPQLSITSTTSMQSNIATTHAIGSASFVFSAFLLLSLF